jgi:hypothetical protein
MKHGCWAACLEECDEKISREHTVSACLFESPEIVVQGFPWCLGKPRTVGLSSLVSKILCRKHNSMLTEVDSAALEALNIFRKLSDLNNARENIFLRKGFHWTIRHFCIDGPLLERWFLKTLINVSVGRTLKIGPDATSAGMPSSELVQIAFGRRGFQEWAGMYTSGYPNQQIHSQEGFRITPVGREDYLTGARFQFRGYNFYLNLLPMKFHKDGVSDLIYRNATFKCVVRQKLSHVVRIRGWRPS